MYLYPHFLCFSYSNLKFQSLFFRCVQLPTNGIRNSYRPLRRLFGYVSDPAIIRCHDALQGHPRKPFTAG